MFGLNPNMEGEAIIQNDIGYFMNTTDELASGVFRLGKRTTHKISGSTYDGSWGLGFSANNANAMYTGEKLQPMALQVLCCIKF